MRIGLLTSSFPRHPADPAGLFVAGMARWLWRGGAEVDVLAPDPVGAITSSGFTVRPIRYARDPVLFYGAGAPDNLRTSWRARFQAPLFLTRLALATREGARGWTHLLSHWLLPCGVTAAAAGRSLPHLVVAHSSDVHLLARLPGAPGLLHALSRPRTRLLCTCAAIRRKLLPLCRTQRSKAMVEGAEIMRMGIEPGGEPSYPPSAPRSRSVLFLGRLVPVKGVDLLLTALAGMPGVELQVAGDGPERRRLERRALELGIRAVFLGNVAGEKKEQLLKEAGVLALPSRVLPDGSTDAAPVVLLEAMAAGLPLVATRVGGNEELIRQGVNGQLVEPEDPGALAAALEAALNDKGELARAGLQTARRHTWDRLAPRVRRLLEQL